MKDWKETLGRRVLDPETRDRWITVCWMILTMAMLLHHIWVTVHFAVPENGSLALRFPWVLLAGVSFFLGRMWKDRGWWVLMALLAVKILRVAIPMPGALSDSQSVFELCLYAFGICYAVGRVLSEKDRERFIDWFCGLWTAAMAVYACIGLYTVWNNAVIPNLGTKKFFIETNRFTNVTRLWPVYHAVEGGVIASAGIATALVGFFRTKQRWVRVLYASAIILMVLMGIFTDSRTNLILTAMGISFPACILCGEKIVKTGSNRKRTTALRAAVTGILFVGLSLVLILLQQQVVPVYNALRTGRNPIISTALAEEAEPMEMLTRQFSLEGGADKFLTGRLTVWKTALTVMGEDPEKLLWGQSVYKVMGPINEYQAAYGLAETYHLHNTFIQTLWESGIPGLLLFAGFFGIFAWSGIRLAADSGAPLWQRLLPLPAALCWLADMVDCTGYCNWGKPPMTILYLFAGLTIAVWAERKRKGGKT